MHAPQLYPSIVPTVVVSQTSLRPGSAAEAPRPLQDPSLTQLAESEQNVPTVA